MRHLPWVIVGLWISSAAASEREWLFPGEYESHQAIWMLWPTFEYKAGFPPAEPAEMIRAMRGHVHVNLEAFRRDREAQEVLKKAFPGREVVPVYSENVNRGGVGMNCITQQQPASATFAGKCGWAKVRVGAGAMTLFAGPTGGDVLGIVPRLTRSGDVYLERLSSSRGRVSVRAFGKTGWVDEDDIESAGERCPAVYSLN